MQPVRLRAYQQAALPLPHDILGGLDEEIYEMVNAGHTNAGDDGRAGNGRGRSGFRWV